MQRTPEQLTYRLQFSHAEKKISAWPGASDEAVLAAIVGIGLGDFRRVKAVF